MISPATWRRPPRCPPSQEGIGPRMGNQGSRASLARGIFHAQPAIPGTSSPLVSWLDRSPQLVSAANGKRMPDVGCSDERSADTE